MPQHNADGTCTKCEPVLVDVKTGRPRRVPALVALYHRQSLEVKHAWHRVTCENSRAPWDMQLLKPFVDEMGALLEGKTESA